MTGSGWLHAMLKYPDPHRHASSAESVAVKASWFDDSTR